jgi:TatD DNase family protein
MLFDSHCHLDYLARDGDLEEVIARARAAGVGTMITICTKLSEFDTVLAIAEQHDDIYCSVGVHPHEADAEGQGDTRRLLALAGHPKVVGIGETGLDYYYEHATRDHQRRSFRAHIAAARETGLPLIVHSRDADDDTAAILRDEYGQGAFPGVIHCFTAGPDLAKSALELGLYISISGIVTFRKAEELRDVVRDIPADRLLVETDAPYLAPEPKRGKRNEPAFVAHTAAAVAKIKGMSSKELESVTNENARRLFDKIPASAAPASGSDSPQ